MTQLFKNIEKETYEDLRHLYINALLGSYDSHTSYYPIEKKEDFDISISGQLEGIGAVLSEKEDYIQVERVVAGGAASRQGDLTVNDKILKVGQGLSGGYESIVGMRVRDAVKLIRGKKGTVVRLWVQKTTGKTVEISITRDVVLLEDTFAKAAVITDGDSGKRTGYIYLPKFYRDFKNKKGRHSSSDVKKLVEQLNDEGVDGVILDLRNNEGGALLDAVELAGLFLKKTPVVQVKDRRNNVQIYRDTDKEVVYDGPLVVMINFYAASAAEIVAAALQDHQRAVIVGSVSYGKGSVQTFIDLKKLYPKLSKINSDLGSIKLTIQKFYRVSGSSTQLKGVSPDIALPDRSVYIDVGERYLDTPLGWDEITSVPYDKWRSPLLKHLEKESQLRVNRNGFFRNMNLYYEKVKINNDRSFVSIALPDIIKRRRLIDELETKHAQLTPDLKHLDIMSLMKDDEWADSLKEDVYLEESLFILYDLIN